MVEFERTTSKLKLATLALALASGCALSACGNKSNQNGTNTSPADQAQIAEVPSPECTESGHDRAYGRQWQTYRSAGFQRYNWDIASRGRYDRRSVGHANNGCAAGYIPSCTSGIGLTCAPAGRFANRQVAWWGLGSQNSIRFCGYAGYAGEYVGTCGSYQQSFYPGAVGRTCLVGVDSCGRGACIPVGNGSAVGVCVR